MVTGSQEPLLVGTMKVLCSRLDNINIIECERCLEGLCAHVHVRTHSLLWKHSGAPYQPVHLMSVFSVMAKLWEPGTELILATIVSPRHCVLPGTYYILKYLLKKRIKKSWKGSVFKSILRGNFNRINLDILISHRTTAVDVF